MITSSVLPWNVGLIIIKNIVEDGYSGNTPITSLFFIILNRRGRRVVALVARATTFLF